MSSFFNDDFAKPAFNKTQPSVNVRELENEFHVDLAVPGLKKDDFNVNIDHDVLTVSATREDENVEEEKGYTRREFNYSSFKRSFSLPETVDAEKISANYNDGILKLVLPKKAEEQKAKRSIEIS